MFIVFLKTLDVIAAHFSSQDVFDIWNFWTLIANIIIDTEVACVDFFHLFLLDFLAEEFSMFHLHLFACIASSIAGAGGD